mmetsp:Transcript_11958/g.36434  ORF Transcript_11958/g.36434 Transcript_11958/m.36434 type:complete len:236 (-) Transcript_11958:199-906(-)
MYIYRTGYRAHLFGKQAPRISQKVLRSISTSPLTRAPLRETKLKPEVMLKRESRLQKNLQYQKRPRQTVEEGVFRVSFPISIREKAALWTRVAVTGTRTRRTRAWRMSWRLTKRTKIDSLKKWRSCSVLTTKSGRRNRRARRVGDEPVNERHPETKLKLCERERSVARSNSLTTLKSSSNLPCSDGPPPSFFNCKMEAVSSSTAWMDGYELQKRSTNLPSFLRAGAKRQQPTLVS